METRACRTHSFPFRFKGVIVACKPVWKKLKHALDIEVPRETKVQKGQNIC